METKSILTRLHLATSRWTESDIKSYWSWEIIFSDILPFLQASQVITVNEQLPLTPVEPEVMTERRTVKICCCIPKGDVLLNAWYINKFLFFLYSEALCMLVDPQKFHLMLRAMTSWPVADVCCQYSIFYSNLRHMQAEIK